MYDMLDRALLVGCGMQSSVIMHVAVRRICFDDHLIKITVFDTCNVKVIDDVFCIILFCVYIICIVLFVAFVAV